MPFDQTKVPVLSPDQVQQARADIAALWDRDGRYIDQLSQREKGAFDRLREKGLAMLEPQSKLDATLGFGKIRVNDEVNMRVSLAGNFETQKEPVLAEARTGERVAES